jgi:hypothetical protein
MTKALSDAAFLAIAEATKYSIGRRVCGKEPSELEPVDVTVFTQVPWIGTESGYAVEIMPQLATEDQPATVEACDRLAADILRDVVAVVPRGAPFHVWVNNGGLTGFADSDPGQLCRSSRSRRHGPGMGVRVRARRGEWAVGVAPTPRVRLSSAFHVTAR